MERLTNKREADAQREGYERRLANGYQRSIPVERFLRLAAYEDTGLEPEEIDMDHEAAETLRQLCRGCDLDRLEELAEADKDGRVVVLPCKVGQRVFALLDSDKHISECEVKRIGLGNEIGFVGLEPIGARGREYGVSLNGFGKTVFLTSEEAKKALEAMMDG
jgi:hypothetical protein|nr:MAG TPA: hypothetical protein [Caudoviricetes sp.]